MSEYPANSAGDFFRLLPFEGYMGVFSFLPATYLAGAARVSKGWRYAVGCRGGHDSSISCTTLSHLKDFLELMVANMGVSSISCDICDLCGFDGSALFASLSSGRCPCPQMLHVTWRCKSLDFSQGGDILRSTFPNLKSLKVDFAAHPLEKIKFGGHSGLARLSLGLPLYQSCRHMRGLQPFHTVYVCTVYVSSFWILLDPCGSFDVVRSCSNTVLTEVRGEFRRLKGKAGH